jgi:hypothetical protein
VVATLFAGDLRTGLIRVRNIPATSASVQAEIGGAGTISCQLSMPMVDPYTGVAIPFRSLILPTRSFLGYEENGKIINAGPIWSDIGDLDKNTITLNAAGLRSYWDYRFILPALQDNVLSDVPAGHDTNLSGLSLRTIAKRYLQQAQTWTAGSVPLVFEDDFLADNIRNVKGEDLKNLNEALSQLSGVIGGPDMAFRPRYTIDGNHVEWIMQTGDPELKQAGPDHIFDMTVPTPSVKGAKVTRDGSQIVTDDYEVGGTPEGQEDASPLMAKSVDTLLTMPGAVRNLAKNGAARISAAGWQNFGGTGVANFTSGGPLPDMPTYVLASGTASQGASLGLSGSLADAEYAMPVDPANSYGVSSYILLPDAGTGGLLLYWFDATGVIITFSTATLVPIPANTWTELTFEATPPAGAASMAVLCRAVESHATAGVAGITVVENLPPVEPFDGGMSATADFEFVWDGPVGDSTSTQFMTGGYPRMESSTDRSSVKFLDTLQDYADSTTKVGEKMVEKWVFTSRKNSAPTFGDYNEGDYCVLVTKNNAIVGTARTRLRMMEVSAKMGDQFVSITCAPERE